LLKSSIELTIFNANSIPTFEIILKNSVFANPLDAGGSLSCPDAY
jgi:hypothetical protein